MSWLKRIFGGGSTDEPDSRRVRSVKPTGGDHGPCPGCGFTYAWNGEICEHCGYPDAPTLEEREAERTASSSAGAGGSRSVSGAEFRCYQPGMETVEDFYATMSEDLIADHGPLVRVDYVSHFPTFEIWFFYEDGASIFSGPRRGRYDINFMSLGYFGEGPRYAHRFLSAAGWDLSAEDIDSIKRGDSIQWRNDRAVIVRKEDQLHEDESGDVVFSHERQEEFGGAPAIYRHYTAPNMASALEFLEKQDVTAQSFFVVVETPEGVIAKDRMGVFEQ